MDLADDYVNVPLDALMWREQRFPSSDSLPFERMMMYILFRGNKHNPDAGGLPRMMNASFSNKFVLHR